MGDTDDKVVLTALMGRLQPSRFLFSLSKSPPNTLEELMIKEKKHMNAKDAMTTQIGRDKESRVEIVKRKWIDGLGGLGQGYGYGDPPYRSEQKANTLIS